MLETSKQCTGNEIKSKRTSVSGRVVSIFETVCSEIESCYMASCINIYGPNQGFTLKCGSHMLTNFVVMQQKGFLDSLRNRSAARHRFPNHNMKNLDAHGFFPNANIKAFVPSFVDNVMKKILNYCAAKIKGQHSIDEKNFKESLDQKERC